ncbi:MOSC N-terminal beta barrel domain-containing protein [Mucilaginibacter sp. PAMB04274]|uniref:MOSC domain-containing protein n=1 Tax=Mucilaginibacter sp. PAMB04274 TaxID=3138568 RepID=UPI0031F625B7
MASISQLYIYPIKSLGGIALQRASLTSRGLEHDRRWILVNDNNEFLSQRYLPQMALFEQQLHEHGLFITYTSTGKNLLIPYLPQTDVRVCVDVWDSPCTGTLVSTAANEWFSQMLGISCRLLYMTDDSIRPVDPRYAGSGHITSFADGYPMLLVSEASLSDLNSRLDVAININRFRPNIVIQGTAPYIEDRLRHFEVAGIKFYGVKPCARCVMIGVDQQTAVTSTEPLKTLSKYRKAGNKIYFGQNIIHNGRGEIKIGDELTVTQLGEELQF